MKKGIHPQLQWVSYVSQSGRLYNGLITRIHKTSKVFHLRSKQEMGQTMSQIAKFKRRYAEETEEEDKSGVSAPTVVGTQKLNAFDNV